MVAIIVTINKNLFYTNSLKGQFGNKCVVLSIIKTHLAVLPSVTF